MIEIIVSAPGHFPLETSCDRCRCVFRFRQQDAKFCVSKSNYHRPVYTVDCPTPGCCESIQVEAAGRLPWRLVNGNGGGKIAEELGLASEKDGECPKLSQKELFRWIKRWQRVRINDWTLTIGPRDPNRLFDGRCAEEPFFWVSTTDYWLGAPWKKQLPGKGGAGTSDSFYSAARDCEAWMRANTREFTSQEERVLRENAEGKAQ